MKFLGKIFSVLIVLLTLHIICIFFVPDFAHSVGEKLGILPFNTWIYDLKGGVDSVSEDMLQLKVVNDTINSAGNAVDKTTSLIQKTQEQLNTTKQAIETKVNQVNKVADSIEKTRDAANELQKNFGDLTTFDSGSTTGTGKTSSGTVIKK